MGAKDKSDRQDADTRQGFICPCCGHVGWLNDAQAAGTEPYDCPDPACGFNQLIEVAPGTDGNSPRA